MSWVVALPLFVVCLTGIALAFEKEFYAWEQPEHYALEVKGAGMSLPEVLAVYESAEPALHLNYLQVPDTPEQAYLAFAREIPDDGSQERGLRAYLNPYTGRIIREYENKTLIRQLELWHRTLTLKQWGRWIVGGSSLLLAVTSLIGLVLWWPMRRRTFRRALRRGKALDWHNALGLIGLLPLCILAITGITFTWGKYIFPPLDQLQGKSSHFELPELTIDEAQATRPRSEWASLAQTAEWVHAEYPEAEVSGVQDSRKPTRPYVFNLRFPGDLHPGGSLRLFFDPVSGELYDRFAMADTGPVGFYRRYFYILHTGHPFPAWARAFWAASSAIGLTLLLTGMWMSVRRWRRERRRAAC